MIKLGIIYSSVFRTINSLTKLACSDINNSMSLMLDVEIKLTQKTHVGLQVRKIWLPVTKDKLLDYYSKK